MAMNTRLDMILLGIQEFQGQTIFEDIKNEVLRLEKKLNHYDTYSQISHINKNAFKEPVFLDDELIKIFSICKKYWSLTYGCFDITILPLLDFWRKKNNQNKKEELAEILKNSGFDNIVFDKKNKSIRFLNSIINVDLGGFGKGYALGKINFILEKYSIHNAFISFGESSILAKGNHPFGEGWKIIVAENSANHQAGHEYILKNQYCSVSGITQQNRTKGEKTFGHIVNPKTGYPQTELSSVSVISSSPVEAECLSTAWLIADEKEKNIISQKFNTCTFNVHKS